MTTPSVLFINRVYPPGRGATGRILRDLAESFAAQGWSVTVLTGGKDLPNEAGNPNITIRRIGKARKPRGAFGYVWIWLRLLIAALGQKRHDLVVTMTDPPMLVVAGRIVASIKKSHHIHWCQDLYPDLFPVAGIKLPRFIMKFLRRLSRKSMKKCDKVITIGRCMMRQLTHTGVETMRVSFVPNWPEAEILDPAYARGQMPIPVRHRFNGAKQDLIRDDSPKFRVLYAGSIGRIHPIKPLIEAAERLKNRPEIEFVFVGDSPGHERLARERDKRGLENIKFLPWQPAQSLRALMESGDIHLISAREGTAGLLVPCKFYAALAVGRPSVYIGPLETEIPRVMEEYGAGTAVAAGNAAALADAILLYRDDPAAWFAAQEGAIRAGAIYVPQNSMSAWIERAEKVVSSGLQR